MEIADPDPLWPAHYEAVAAELAQALGPALGASLRAVEHVGSTSVPGLPAKPVIDVMAAVDALADVPFPDLAARGFEPRATGMKGRLFLRREAGPGAGRPAVHLHVVPWDGFLDRKERRFRDRLRAHPEEARAYGELKRALAAAHGHDVDAYTRAKTGFIQEVMDRDAAERGRPREEVWE